MARIVRAAPLIVLILAAAPPAAIAQPLVCQAIRRGESASQAARRVTGDARKTYQASFQIMNDSSKFIPKSQYNRVRPGWQACVVTPAESDTSSNVQRLTTSGTPEADASDAFEAFGTRAALTTVDVVGDAVDGPQFTASDPLRTIRSVDLTMVWLGAAIVVPWFGWRLIGDHLARRKTRAIVVRDFALRFVDEFERPLVPDRVAERPVRSRLRTSVRRGRFDILLAPGTGRRYPNLSDHRRNVEYDIARVMQMLPDDFVVRGPLSTHAEWVVVPLQLKAGPTHRRAFGASPGPGQSGVTCIFSS
jgi:hypothetical protein